MKEFILGMIALVIGGGFFMVRDELRNIEAQLERIAISAKHDTEVNYTSYDEVKQEC